MSSAFVRAIVLGDRSRCSAGAILLSAVSLLAWSANANADPVPDKYQAYADFGGGPSDAHVGPNSASASVAIPDGGLAAFATATNGRLGATATAGTLTLSSPLVGAGYSWLARSGAAIRIVDAFVQGSGDTVAAPMNLYLDGSLRVSVAPNPSGSQPAWFNDYSDLFVDIIVKPISSASYYAARGRREVAVGAYADVPLNDGRTISGFLGNGSWSQAFGYDSISGVILTSPLLLPVNQLFEIDIQITATAQAFVYAPSQGADLNLITVATSNFGQTAGFQAASQVLVLPSGFNFSAPSVGIVDNICAGETCIQSAVPEPSRSILILLGFSAVGLFTRLCRQANAATLAPQGLSRSELMSANALRIGGDA